MPKVKEFDFREKLAILKKLKIEPIDIAVALDISQRTVERAGGANGFPRKGDRKRFEAFYNKSTGRL